MAAKLGLGVFFILRMRFSQIRIGLFKGNGKRTRINKIERPIVHDWFDRLKDFPVSFDAQMIFWFTKKAQSKHQKPADELNFGAEPE